MDGYAAGVTRYNEDNGASVRLIGRNKETQSGPVRQLPGSGARQPVDAGDDLAERGHHHAGGRQCRERRAGRRAGDPGHRHRLGGLRRLRDHHLRRPDPHLGGQARGQSVYDTIAAELAGEFTPEAYQNPTVQGVAPNPCPDTYKFLRLSRRKRTSFEKLGHHRGKSSLFI